MSKPVDHAIFFFNRINGNHFSKIYFEGLDTANSDMRPVYSKDYNYIAVPDGSFGFRFLDEDKRYFLKGELMTFDEFLSDFKANNSPYAFSTEWNNISAMRGQEVIKTRTGIYLPYEKNDVCYFPSKP